MLKKYKATRIPPGAFSTKMAPTTSRSSSASSLTAHLYDDILPRAKHLIQSVPRIKELGIHFLEAKNEKKYISITAAFADKSMVLTVWPVKQHAITLTVVYMIWKTAKLFEIDFEKIDSVAVYMPDRLPSMGWELTLAEIEAANGIVDTSDLIRVTEPDDTVFAKEQCIKSWWDLLGLAEYIRNSL